MPYSQSFFIQWLIQSVSRIFQFVTGTMKSDKLEVIKVTYITSVQNKMRVKLLRLKLKLANN